MLQFFHSFSILPNPKPLLVMRSVHLNDEGKFCCSVVNHKFLFCGKVMINPSVELWEFFIYPYGKKIYIIAQKRAVFHPDVPVGLDWLPFPFSLP
jgi:hypothetical protein